MVGYLLWQCAHLASNTMHSFIDSMRVSPRNFTSSDFWKIKFFTSLQICREAQKSAAFSSCLKWANLPRLEKSFYVEMRTQCKFKYLNNLRNNECQLWFIFIVSILTLNKWTKLGDMIKLVNVERTCALVVCSNSMHIQIISNWPLTPHTYYCRYPSTQRVKL